MKDITRVQNILSNQVQTRTLCFKTPLALGWKWKTKQKGFRGRKTSLWAGETLKSTLELGWKRFLVLLVFESQRFGPFQLLVHFIPNHSPINEDKNHSGEKQRLEDFPLLSGANPTAHVLNSRHIQQLAPKLPLFYGLYIPRAVFESRTSQLRWKQILGCGTSIPRVQEKLPIQLCLLSKVSKSKQKLSSYLFSAGKQTELVLGSFLSANLTTNTDDDRFKQTCSLRTTPLDLVTCHRATADLKEVPPWIITACPALTAIGVCAALSEASVCVGTVFTGVCLYLFSWCYMQSFARLHSNLYNRIISIFHYVIVKSVIAISHTAKSDWRIACLGELLTYPHARGEYY